ncbi:hypothetical protein MTO96_028043 [Rhipicephalus appendiculatus]
MIGERGLHNRVSIADHHIKWSDAVYFPVIVDINRVTVKASHFAFGMQPVFNHFEHVTSLRVNCDLFEKEDFAALCEYLSASSALTDVEITLVPCTLRMTAEQSRSVPTRLSSALTSNANLCSVILKGLQLGNDDLDALADYARKSSLDSLACSALVDIQKSTHRNASRVSAAARFVLGERDSAEAALGIELFYDHPHLLELVRDGAPVDTVEAKAMIRHARNKVRGYGMHKFMRTAGVVAQSVECHPQRDGRLQLCDINEDCWSVICSYLSLTDVVETAAPPDDMILPADENQADGI